MTLEELKEFLKDDGLTFPQKERSIPLQAVWEYLGYLEISLDSFDLAIKNLQADFFMITSQIGNYAKEKIEDFISNNGYQQQDEEIFSFELFNKYVYYDGNLLYRLSCGNEMDRYANKEKKWLRGYDAVNGTARKNIISGGDYRIDLCPHITNQKYQSDFYKFFTDKDIFQALYDCAEKDKKEITDFSQLLNAKLNVLNTKLNGFSEDLISNLTNQNLIHWYILLQKYIGKAMTLVANNSVSNKIDTKQLTYIIKMLFEYYLNIDTKEASFIDFTRGLTGTAVSTTEKYLRSPTMGYKEEAFTDTWIDSLALLERLDTENPKVRELIRFVLEEKYRQKKGLSTDKQATINEYLEKYP